MHLIHKVELEFDESDFGQGLVPKHNKDFASWAGSNEFDPFWNGIGIFHDVFEHWFEYKDKHFQGKAAYNIGGEMAAMGACVYFLDGIYLGNRIDSSYKSPEEVIIDGTSGILIDSILSGYGDFGEELISDVPRQKPVDNGFLECMLENYMDSIYSTSSLEDSDSPLLKSITQEKVEDLHRYGYRMAERKFKGNHYLNGSVLYNFIEFWEEFTRKNEVEDIAPFYSGITFRIYKHQGDLSWTATFNERYCAFIDEGSERYKQRKIKSNSLDNIVI